MKIDNELINKIFNFKIKIKGNDKELLSRYEEILPMYDIYTSSIYPINKIDIELYLSKYHLRFIDKYLLNWITKLYNKYKDYEIGDKYKKCLDIIDNYNVDILIETCYKVLYKISSGLKFSICKRESFNKYLYHITPYYSIEELIKLGKNIGINVVDDIYTVANKNYKDICKKISHNDVSFNEIQKHYNYIIRNNIISWVCFYSFIGSFLFNQHLRKINTLTFRERGRIHKSTINKLYYSGLYNLTTVMKNTPELDNDYYLYRFLWDDSFLQKLKIGDIFMDKGFVSCTRNPFYSPGLDGVFGLILIKIKIPKNTKGIGLFIENFSLFPNEEELILAPYSKLKLISKDSDFKYYHINKDFEKLINKKYEFEFISNDYDLFYKENIPPKLDYDNYIDIKEIKLSGCDRIDLLQRFINGYSNNGSILININKKKYNFIYHWFDATGSYEKFYYNKQKDGVLFSLFDEDGYPYLNIEIGKVMVINYINQFYYSNNIIANIDNNELINVIYGFGKLFYYKTCIIYHHFNSFIQFKNNYPENTNMFLYFNLFNQTIYEYLKYGKKYFDNIYIDYPIGYYQLDEYFNNLDKNIKLREPFEKCKNNKEIFLTIVEKDFNYYKNIINKMNKQIFSYQYVKFNIYNKMITTETNYEWIDFKDDIKDLDDNNYKLIFRQPIRRR